MTYTFERAFSHYISAFDGTCGISTAEFQSRFDNVFHDDFTFFRYCNNDDDASKKEFRTLTREEVYVDEAAIRADGTSVAMIHFRRIGSDCIDIKLRLVNGDNESISRVFLTITDDKAIKSKEIDDSSTSSRLRLHVGRAFFFLLPKLSILGVWCKKLRQEA
jgi:hypothetical protein